MNSNTITTFFVLVIGLVMAVVIGSLLVTDQLIALAWVGGIGLFAACLALGKNIWLLIPFCFYLKLEFPWLPGRFAPIHLAVMLVTVWFALLFAMRRIQLKMRFTSIELMALLLILCIVQVYLRHPVGFQVLGSSSFGARPYFEVVISIIGFFILSSVAVDPKRVKSAMTAMLLGGSMSVGIKILAMAWAPFGMLSARYLGGVGSTEQAAMVQGDLNSVVDSDMAGRNFAFMELATVASRWISSRLNPISALVRPLWLIAILIVAAAAALSGFRNVIALAGLNFLVAAYYWGRLQSVILMGFLAVFGTVLLAVVNLVVPLPANVQRAVSFLPGTWEERHIRDASGSTEWRLEMWKEALFTDRYIDNKLLGDGLGFKASEFNGLQTLREMAGSNIHASHGVWDLQREAAMLAGDYHSGPVSYIRTIGYVGLAISLIAMCLLTVHAHRLLLRAKGTEWFTVTCFFCIPVIWWPFFFVFIGGGFNLDMPQFFFYAGFLRLLQNNLPLRETSEARERMPAARPARQLPV